MNLILFSEEDRVDDVTVRLNGRRYQHVREIHRAQVGDRLRIGQLGGLMGEGEITAMSSSSLDMRVELDQAPPAPLPLTLLLALPRPKFLKRVLQTVTSLGVKQIYLFNSYRVEKVYWSCEQLSASSMHESFLLGLEQARDTILPEVHLRRLFKPFVEDELPAIIEGSRALIAHPNVLQPCPSGVEGQVSLAVGPEGGFIEYEVDKLEQAGLEPVSLYPRILKVETAVTALVGRLMP